MAKGNSKRKTSSNSNSSTKKNSGGKLAGIITFICTLILAVYFAATGEDPAGLFTTTPTPTTPTPVVVTDSGSDWWQVYFSDPVSLNDPNNLTGTIPEKLIELINDAERSIHIAAFEFDLTPVAEALIAAHQRGVQVQWVTDDEFGLVADEDAGHGQFAMLRQAGIEVRDDGRSALMHNKFIIFDGRTVWTGSTNLTRNGSFRNNNNVLVIRSPRLAGMYEREFAEMWEERRFGPRSPSTLDDQSTRLNGTPVQVIFAPEDKAIDQLIPLIANAQESIRFMAFSFTHAELGAAVRERMEAGVDVQGIFELRGSQTEFSQLRPLYCVNRLAMRQDGNPGTFHHKVIVIDNRTVITGSLNFSNNANNSNDENVLVLTNPAIAANYLQEFERRWTEAFDPNTPLSLLPSALAAEVMSLGPNTITC